MDYTYITNNGKLIAYLDSLDERKNCVIALDLEAESNLHAYGQKLCLVQIFDGTNKVLVDPLEIDTQPLKSFFESRNILKIVYDASSDSSLLKNVYNIEIKSLLDLRPAVELLNYARQDLHSVIAAELGVNLNHKEKFQRHNWMKRPIDKEALDYAFNDVFYLFKLKDALFNKLYAGNLLDMFILKNLQVQNKDYAIDPRDRYRRTKGYHALAGNEKVIFRKIYDIREKYAQMCDLPAYSVISREDLLEIAKDTGYIDKVRFPHRLSRELVQQILTELKSVS